MTTPQYSMGIGLLGAGTTVFKSKFRWVFSLSWQCGIITRPWTALTAKSASRPKMTQESVPVRYQNEVAYWHGVTSWEPLTLTIHDIARDSPFNELYDQLANYFPIADPNVANKPNTLKQNRTNTQVKLELLDGCGCVVETWLLNSVFPTEVDFGSLDMAASETCDISMTLVFSSAQLIPATTVTESIRNACTLNIDPSNAQPGDDIVITVCCPPKVTTATVGNETVTTYDYFRSVIVAATLKTGSVALSATDYICTRTVTELIGDTSCDECSEINFTIPSNTIKLGVVVSSNQGGDSLTEANYVFTPNLCCTSTICRPETKSSS